jgi:hypothetical protein
VATLIALCIALLKRACSFATQQLTGEEEKPSHDGAEEQEEELSVSDLLQKVLLPSMQRPNHMC